MGEAKYNPNVKLAKEGKLPLKEKPMGKRELERTIHAMAWAHLINKYLIPKEIENE